MEVTFQPFESTLVSWSLSLPFTLEGYSGFPEGDSGFGYRNGVASRTAVRKGVLRRDDERPHRPCIFKMKFSFQKCHVRATAAPVISRWRSIWAHQFDGGGLFSATKLKNLYYEPSMSTQEKSASPSGGGHGPALERERASPAVKVYLIFNTF